jgi:outer membrane protein assembly complex protein YaeT
MKQRSRKVRISVAAASLAVALLVALAMLHTGAARRCILGEIADYLRDRQGIILSVEEFRYNLLALSAAVRGLELKSAADPEAPAFLRVGRGQFRLHFPGGLTPAVGGSLDEVEIRVMYDARGHSNLPATRSAGKGAPPGLLVSGLTISRGSIRFRHAGRAVAAELPEWSLEIRGDAASRNHRLAAHAARPGSLSYDGRVTAVDAFHLEVRQETDRLRIDRLEASAGGSSLRISGLLSGWDDPRLDLAVDGDLDLARQADLFPAGFEPAGRLKVKGSARGPASAPEFSGDVEGTGLQALGLDRISLRARVSWSGAKAALSLDHARLESPYGSAQCAAALSLAGADAPSSLAAALRDVDLEAASRALRLPLAPAARASGSVQASWNGLDLASARAAARIELRPTTHLPERARLPLAGTIDAQYKEGLLELHVPAARVLGSDVQGRLSVDGRRRLAGSVTAATAGLSNLRAALGRFLGWEDGIGSGTEIDGSARLDLEITGTLDDPGASGTLTVREGRVGSIAGIALDARMQLDSKSLELLEARMAWQEHSLRMGGRIDLSATEPAFRFAAAAEDLSLTSLAAGLGLEIPLAGSLALRSHFEGTAAEPKGKVALAITGLAAYGERFDTLTADLSLAGPRIALERLDLVRDGTSSRSADLHAEGWFDFKTQETAFRLDAHDLRMEGLSLPGDLPVRGSLDMTAEGSGTLADPHVAASLRGRDIRIADYGIGNIALEASSQGSELRLAGSAPGLGLATRASIALHSPHASTFEVRADGFDLARIPVPGPAGLPLRGTLSAEARGMCDLIDPLRGSFSARVNLLNLEVGESKIHNEAPVTMEFAGGFLEIHPTAFVSEGSRIAVGGRIPVMDRGAALALEVEGQADVAKILSLLPIGKAVAARGALHASTRLEGTLERLRPSGRITLEEGWLQIADSVPPLEDLSAELRLDHGALHADAIRGRWGGGEVHLQGSMPLRLLSDLLPVRLESSAGPARFTAELDKLTPESIPALSDRIAGAVTLDISGEADRLSLEALAARLTLQELRLSAGSYQVEQAGAGIITIRGGTATIEPWIVSGPGTKLSIRGTAGLLRDAPLDLHVDGLFDAGLLSYWTESLRAAGETRLNLTLSGRLGAPEIHGFLEAKRAQLEIESPGLRAENLDIRVSANPQGLHVERIRGELNGGSLEAGGRADIAGIEVRGFEIEARVSGASLDFPAGLRSAVDAELSVRSAGERILVGGAAHILEGSYTEPLDIERELLRYLRSDQTLTGAGEPDPRLARIRYDVKVDTRNPVVIDNNLARLALVADLSLAGSYYRPVVTGRISLQEGGELFLRERTYAVERGTIDLISQARIEPSLDILAKTRVGSYEIDLEISGTPDDLKTALRSPSHPELSEPDLVSVLLTGRTLDDVRGAELNIASRQVQSYLAGRVGGLLSRQAERTLGLSEVRIEPNLIAPESEPGARLTIGQNVTRQLRLVYSMDLADSRDQIWIADYDVTRRFNTKATRQSDGSYRFDLRHDLRFGGGSPAAGPAPRTGASTKVGAVRIGGNPVFQPQDILARLGLKSGEAYDFFKLQRSLDRLRAYYYRQGYLEARLRIARRAEQGRIDIEIEIDPGPKVSIDFEGASLPSAVRDAVRRAWQASAFDATRTQAAVRVILQALIRSSYLQPRVEPAVEGRGIGEKRVVFRIDPGARYESSLLVLEGNISMPSRRLEDVLSRSLSISDLYLDPNRAVETLAAFYRGEGFLDARIARPRFEFDPEAKAGRVIIGIDEGPQYRVNAVGFTGNRQSGDDRLRAVVGPLAGTIYTPDVGGGAAGRLEEYYWKNGFNDVGVTWRTEKRTAEARVDLVFDISEKLQDVVREIAVEGNRRTDEQFARERLELQPGDVLDYDRLNRSRKKLYDTGAYARADILVEESAAIGSVQAGQRPVRLKLHLREVPPYQIRYGGFYDTERGPGAIVDASYRNFPGNAGMLGLRARYDSDIHEVRAYFSQPLGTRVPLANNASVFARRELFPSFINDTLGFSLQQEARPRPDLILSYGYRYSRTHTYDKVPDPFFPFDVTIRTSRLTGSASRDKRDDLLDAARGSFTSHAFELAPASLKSDLRFVRYYGQYFHYVPLSRPTEIPFGGGRQKSRFVLASGVRLGLVKGLGGQEVLRTERFFAGGGTTVRGFAQDALGPVDFFGEPAGGEAVFVMNNEIRFPLYRMVDGVGFLDLGNVYARITDLDPFRVRKSAGLGLRIRSPYVLLRFDYGLKLDRLAGESRGAFFFSIGQAF